MSTNDQFGGETYDEFGACQGCPGASPWGTVMAVHGKPGRLAWKVARLGTSAVAQEHRTARMNPAGSRSANELA